MSEKEDEFPNKHLPSDEEIQVLNLIKALNNYYTTIPGVIFTSDGLSRLWNEMVKDGELCGDKCDLKFVMTEITFSAWPPTDLWRFCYI